MALKADAVFDGGGVKGIGLVGALVEAERLGYTWMNVAGTSAGAIVAALVAAGYTGLEIRGLLERLNFEELLDKSALDRVPVVGPAISIGLTGGIYGAEAFEAWLRRLLLAKGIKTFGDLRMPGFEAEEAYRYRLRVIASDISLARLVALPQDIRQYGMDPDALDVARAVRMSISIPFVFEPVVLRYKVRGRSQYSYIVDGGILSNFPVWLFDSPGRPAWPTFGFRLVEPDAGRPRQIRGPLSMAMALLFTMMEAHDNHYIEDAHFVRSITVPTMGVATTDFALSKSRRDALYEAGVQAARQFFATWDFGHYVTAFRSGDGATPAGAGVGAGVSSRRRRLHAVFSRQHHFGQYHR